MAAVTRDPVVRAGTFSALRYANYRLYFAGQIVSVSGSWMQTVAQGWLVYHLTQSELWLGIVAAAAGLPSLVISPFAGVLIDRVSRRTILMATQIVLMLLAAVIAALTLSGTVQVWHVVALAALAGIANAVDAPARQAFVRDMVGRENISSGVTLNSMMFNSARIIGPTMAGITLATVGAGWCFLINAASFMAAIVALRLMRLEGAPVPSVKGVGPLVALRDGVRFARSHITIGPLLVLSSVTCLFAVNIVAVLPSFAAVTLRSPIDGYSTLSMAQGIGAVLGALGLAFFGRTFGRGHVISAMTVLLTVSVVGLATTTEVLPAALCMVGLGFSIVMFFVNINTLIQDQVPDEYRGRVLSLYTLTFMGLSPIGSLVLGALANQIGTPPAIALYGLLNGALGVMVLLRQRALWRLS
jgi:MFS family permease